MPSNHEGLPTVGKYASYLTPWDDNEQFIICAEFLPQTPYISTTQYLCIAI